MYRVAYSSSDTEPDGLADQTADPTSDTEPDGFADQTAYSSSDSEPDGFADLESNQVSYTLSDVSDVQPLVLE
jgi:hypothetical protein